jgi:hypothetical protein
VCALKRFDDKVGGRSDDFVAAHLGDRFRAVAQFRQYLVSMLAQQRGARDLRREVGELDRAADDHRSQPRISPAGKLVV